MYARSVAGQRRAIKSLWVAASARMQTEGRLAFTEWGIEWGKCGIERAN